SACICKRGGRPPPHEHCAIGGVGCARPADEICEPGRLMVATRPNWTGSALNLVSLAGRMAQAPEGFKRLRRRSATSPDKKNCRLSIPGRPKCGLRWVNPSRTYRSEFRRQLAMGTI